MPVIPCAVRARAHGFLAFLLCMFCAATVSGGQELLLGVTLNEVDKGVFFAFQTPDGDLVFAEEDLRAMGFRLLPGEPSSVGGRPHRALRALGNVQYAFDPGTVTVRVTAPPELLEKKVIDFLAGAAKDVEYPTARSAFLNYRLVYHGGEGAAPTGFDGVGEAGLRAGGALFVTDAVYRGDDEEDPLVRLGTRVSWEDRGTLRRLTLGDVASAPGGLWGSPRLGGVSFSKVSRMDPYLIRHPSFELSGQAQIPSELRVYLDGVLVKREELPPGEFEIKNFRSYGGDREVEVVIRDAFGRETRIERAFYFTDAVLRSGFHEYSYNLGWLRDGYGEESNRYVEPALSAFHRYGLTDACTVGFAAEAAGGTATAGPTLALVADRLGTLSLSASAGRVDRRGEYAAQAAHEYQGARLSTRLRFMRSTEGYRTLLEDAESDRTSAQLEAGVGFGSKRLGSLQFSWSAGWAGPGDDHSRIGASYQLGLFGKASFFATVGRSRDGDKRETDVFAGLTYFPGPKLTVTAQHTRRAEASQTALEVSRDREGSEGLAWRTGAQWRTDALTVNPWAEYYGRHGTLAGDFVLSENEGGEAQSRFDLTAAGSVLVAGGALGFGRPVQDSFALVKVGEEGLPGVRVYHGGSAAGVTGEDGALFVTEVSSYVHNQLSIEPKDIPLEYSLDRMTRVVSPAERSGSVVVFGAARYQAVTGRLSLREGGELRPMEYLEIAVRAGEHSWTIPSGKGGEFFLENVGSGFVSLSFRDRDRTRACDIYVPESDDLIVEVGEVSCEFLQ